MMAWIGMLVGGALEALLGAIIGYLGFRFGLRGFYFVLLTVAFAAIFVFESGRRRNSNTRLSNINEDNLVAPAGFEPAF